MSDASANGNVIVVAGAGTGKTYNLVQRCLSRVLEGASIDEMLIVTFTKAAAAELRQRIDEALQKKFAEDPSSAHLARQIALLDRAKISTLHSFCLELVSTHFSELGLSPRLITLEGAQAAVLRSEALEALFEVYFEGRTAAARESRRVLMEWFHGDDRAARAIILKLHEFTQTRPDPAGWFAKQRALLAKEDPTHWREWHSRALEDWVKRWRPAVAAQPSVRNNPAREMILAAMDKFDAAAVDEIFRRDELYPDTIGKFRKPLTKMFEEAAVLAGWFQRQNGDTLLEDWKLVRDVTLRLLQMAEEFSARFAELKLERGLVDFTDLEQFSLRLLWDGNKPSEIAAQWRKRLKWIFVDEYQDINAAQDRIIQALAREGAVGNRYLVGDVKQSIYGFRQAEPHIFLNYESAWEKGAGGRCERLVNNWRSHERILDFVNGLFAGLMTGEVGDVVYDQKTRLIFAQRPERMNLSREKDSAVKVEVHLVEKNAAAESDDDDEAPVEVVSLSDFEKAEAEAELIAQLCFEMVEKHPLTLPTGERATYGDIVILMRSAATEVEAFAKVFSRRGIPLDARRTGFFSCIEVLDLLNLLTVLDNPLQDIPLLGLLRSPIGCFSVEDLAQVRVTKPGQFWEALRFCANEPGSGAHAKAKEFVTKIDKWRRLSRESSLAQRLETIIEETGYEDWIGAQYRGAQRRANVRRLVELARQFDAARGEGLYWFLQYVEDQTKAVGDIAPASVSSHGAVRLMTTHQSKGLQFPIVIVAGLNKQFNQQDFRGLALLDEEFGLCLKARPPHIRRQYETIAFWMARHRQEKKLLDEEMRILYVALTRAQHRLLLVGTPARKARTEWQAGGKRAIAAKSTLDWIGPWLAKDCPAFVEHSAGEANDWSWRWHKHIHRKQERSSLQAPVEDNLSPEKLAELKARIEWRYPFSTASAQEAKSSATALRRALADEPELARPIAVNRKRTKAAMTANEAGQATHRFMQHARLEAFADLGALSAEVDRLKQSAILKSEEASAVDFEKIHAFWTSEFGLELLSHSERLERELAFTAKFSNADLRSVRAPMKADFGENEFIVVQGAADLVAIFDDELWLVDFKTDRIPEEMLAPRVQEYSLQLRIYALALSRVYKRPVTRVCLHFLEHGRTEFIEL